MVQGKWPAGCLLGSGSSQTRAPRERTLKFGSLEASLQVDCNFCLLNIDFLTSELITSIVTSSCQTGNIKSKQEQTICNIMQQSRTTVELDRLSLHANTTNCYCYSCVVSSDWPIGNILFFKYNHQIVYVPINTEILHKSAIWLLFSDLKYGQKWSDMCLK